MRYVVYGAGAIGGIVGARLFQHGHDVVLIARGAHGDRIRADGLRVEDPDGVAVLDVPAVDHPGRLRWAPGDVALVTTKAQDTAAAVDHLAAVAPAEVAVVCVQNGVENERIALRRFRNVYGACVMTPAACLRPGVVQAYAAPLTGIIDVGRWPRGVDEVAEQIAAAFAGSAFSSQGTDDIERWKYRKLLGNLGNAVEALCGPEARDGPVSELAEREGAACLDAAGIAYASADEDKSRRGDLVRRRPVGGQRRPGGSSWQSLHRGTGTIETDYLNGEIVLLGRLHAVATPVNTLLQRLANEAARTHARPGSLRIEALLDEVRRSS